MTTEYATHFIDNHAQGRSTRISLLPTGKLIGLVRFLARRHCAHLFLDQQGDQADLVVKGLCRELRIRLRNQPRVGRFLAMAAFLDPPPCRCGRPGTRVIGRETFCAKCGPSAGALVRKQWYADVMDHHVNAQCSKHAEIGDLLAKQARDTAHKNARRNR